MVAKFGQMESDLSLLNSMLSHDEIKCARHDVLDKLAKNQSKPIKHFEILNAKWIGPMAKFNAEAMN
jgi:hypothetical protein